MNILYIAYSCLPHKGSEEKIGWNVPLESAKKNNVFVVTKEEHRPIIEEYIKTHNIDNPKFYFVDINSVYKNLFKGALYPIRLNFWHKKAYPFVKELCEKENIDVIHQITPVEFRSIGNYGSIDNTKFICGPIGGGEPLPEGLRCYAKGNMTIERMRCFLNRWSKFRYKQTGTLRRCDYMLFVNKETQDYLSDSIDGVPYNIYPEIGVNEEEIVYRKQRKNCPSDITFLVAGRLVYRKGHSFLLDVLRELPEDLPYLCRIAGDGPERSRLEAKCREYGLQDKVVFTGRLEYFAMAKEYENADVFIMPSIRETTGTVLLEAISKGLPVITINRFGGSVLLNNNCAYFYDGKTTEDIKNSLKQAILSAVSDRQNGLDTSAVIADRAKQHLWENKLDYYNSLYGKIIND